MGLLVFQQSSGGTINVQGTNTASAFTWTIPASTDTFVGLAASQTLTSKTLTSPVISGGTIDNAVIGGTTAAAGSFTSVSASTSVTTPFVTSAASTNLLLKSAGTTAITIDTNQNVGVGVTPSAWGVKAIQMTGGISAFVGDTRQYYGCNVYINSSIAPKYITSNYAVNYAQDATGGTHAWQVASPGSAGGTITWNTAMTLDNSGNFMVGTTSPSGVFTVSGSSSQGTRVTQFLISGVSNIFSLYSVSADSSNTAATASRFGQNTSTSRSINAGGTVNVSGLDYAEYMVKSGNFTINKGDICGIDANGKLTNVFANAISFVVKSTNPSYIGGDVWHLQAGTEPIKPNQPVRAENESDSDWITIEANYQTALATYNTELTAYNTALEAARQTVDRIAFSGQVPVNVTGATAGQYIVPVAKQDGSIGGEAVSESAITPQQYMQSVGKVISVANNVTTIIVKVA